VVNPAREAWGPFIAPRESSHRGVRDPDMSWSGGRHIWPTSLETCLGTRYVPFGDLVTEESG
jgi:hypothetical protein